MLDNAVETILQGVSNLIKSVIGTIRNETKKRFKRLEAKVYSNHSELKDEINDLKADLVDIPSRSEFDAFKLYFK